MYCKIIDHLDQENRKMLVRGIFGNENSTFFCGSQILFLKLTMVINLIFKVTQIMDQDGTWNSRFPFKPLTGIFLNVRSVRYVNLPDKIFSSKTAFTRCRHILKTVKNVTVAEFEPAFTRCQNNLEAVGNLAVRNSLQDFDWSIFHHF